MSADDEAPPDAELTRSAASAAPEPVRDGYSAGSAPVRDPERYEVICEHGRGGLGRVSRAYDKELGRDVAIKELLSRGPISELRFAREARITARLEHPGIVPVHETGRWPDGTPFYAMKLVSGRPLRALIAERNTVDERIALLHHVIAVADAMAYAHGRNIIHRDLKPANVIVGEFGETVVIDWGLAKDLSDSARLGGDDCPGGGGPDLTTAGSVLGTPAYMPPEQERGEAVDQRADVFAIGAMLWELCSLHKVPPVDRQVRHRLLRRSGIDRDLAVIVDKALDPQPERRYRHAGELAADLNAFKSGARISARTYSLAGILAHWTRRHRVLAVAAFTLAAVVLVSVVALAALYRDSRRNATIAEQRLVHSYLERGRTALLADQYGEALVYLTEAAHRGEHSTGLRFMLERAAEPLAKESLALHSGAMRAWTAQFSSDERRIVTGDDHGAKIWDARTGQQLLDLPNAGTAFVASYTPDNRHVVTIGRDGFVNVWDAATGALERVVARPSTVDANVYRAGALSPNGGFVAAVEGEGTLHVWELDSGAEVLTLPYHAPSATVAFSPDSKWLAVVGADPMVFDTTTWKLRCAPAEQAVVSAVFDRKGSRLLTGSTHGDVSTWDIPSCGLIRHLVQGGEPIGHVAFSPDGLLAAAAGTRSYGEDTIWRVDTGEVQAHLGGHRRGLAWIEFDSQSKLVVHGGSRGRFFVADAFTGVPLSVIDAPSFAAVDLHFDASSQHVIGAAFDGKAHVWNIGAPQRRWSTAEIGRECGTGVTLGPEHRFVAISCPHRTTRIWDTAAGRLVAELPSVEVVGWRYASYLPALSENADRVAITRGTTVEIYALPIGRRERIVQHGAPVTAVRFAHRDSLLVVGGLDGRVQLVRDDRPEVTLTPSAEAIDAVDVLADGRVVIADRHPRLRILDPRRGVVQQTELPTRVGGLRVSLDSNRVLAVPVVWAPGPAHLYVLSLGRLTALTGHTSQVYSAQFVREGREIVTTSSDGSTRFWDGWTGAPRRTLFATEPLVMDAALAPNDELVVTAGADGKLRFWDERTQTMLWAFAAHGSLINAVHFEGEDLISRGAMGELSRWRFSTAVEYPGWLARFDRLVRCGPWRFDEASGALVAQVPSACE